MFGRKDYRLTVRMAPEDESGRYAISEVALINTVDDEDMSPLLVSPSVKTI